MMSHRSALANTEPAALAEDWQATRTDTGIVTRLLGDEDDYLAGGSSQVGRRIGPTEHELFVSCAPELALQQQFEHLRPDFIAVHDLGTTATRKLLIGLAAAGGRSLQRLAIRRQSHGNVLATLEFAELPTADGGHLRVYATTVDADTAVRQQLARLLLAFARVGALMVGHLPAHAVGSMLAPFRDAMLAGPWPNRELLLLPLSAGTLLGDHAADLARGTGVRVRATPQVVRPADAWGYINGTLTRLRQREPSQGQQLPELLGAPAGNPNAERSAAQDAYPVSIERRARRREPIGRIRPTAAPGPVGPAPVTDALLERYARQVAALPGVLACCVFDVERGVPAAACGADPGATELAHHGKALLATLGASGTALGGGTGCAEAAITLESRHLLLRALPGRRGLALHAVLDKTSGNLTLARLQIQRLDAVFDPPGRG